MRDYDRDRLADHLRRALYVGGFAIAMGSVWAMGWSRQQDAALAESLAQPDPLGTEICLRAHAARTAPHAHPVVADARQ